MKNVHKIKAIIAKTEAQNKSIGNLETSITQLLQSCKSLALNQSKKASK